MPAGRLGQLVLERGVALLEVCGDVARSIDLADHAGWLTRRVVATGTSGSEGGGSPTFGLLAQEESTRTLLSSATRRAYRRSLIKTCFGVHRNLLEPSNATALEGLRQTAEVAR